MKTESEINFKDIVLYVFRNILIVIIVGAIVGCALSINSYFEKKKINDVLDITKKINASETDFQYETRVFNISRARTYAKMIDNVNEQLDKERDYIANSIAMQIDPDNIYQSTAQLTLTIENNSIDGLDEALLSAYNREIYACNYLSEYAESIGKKPEFIKELFSVSNSNSDNLIVSVDDKEINRVESLYINVVGPTREFCDEVMEILLNELESIHTDLNKSIAPHKLSLVAVQKIVKSDNAYRESQNGHMSRLDSLQAQIVGYYNGIENIAKDLGLSGKESLIKYFSTHEEVVVDGIPTSFSEKTVNSNKDFKQLSSQFGIGFGIGAGVVIVLLVICYLFSRMIKTQAQFFGIFPNITKIGVMKPSGKNVFTKWVNRCSEDDTKLSSENTNKLISTNYSNLTKDYQKVLITGIGDKSAMEKAVKELNIKGDFKPDMFSNPEVLDLVPNYDCVVLLEQRKKSLYRDIKNEIRLISNAGTKIVGAILI